MSEAFICDAIRTPFGRYGGALSSVRADDLGAIPIKALMARNKEVDWAAVSDVLYGCANQAGEDNRNVARMAGLLAGLPVDVPGATINRLCGSGMDAAAIAARTIRAGEADLAIAGGVESMSRAPFVMPKADTAISRTARIVDKDEHPRDTTLEALAALKPIVRADGTVTAGNASGVNDGACALLVASDTAVRRYQLTPKARIVGAATAGVPPRIMGMGPAP